VALPRSQPSPPSFGSAPPPWWLVAVAFIVVAALLFGLMLALHWCGGPGERPRITPIIPFRP
jgi:hypothetical protein